MIELTAVALNLHVHDRLARFGLSQVPHLAIVKCANVRAHRTASTDHVIIIYPHELVVCCALMKTHECAHAHTTHTHTHTCTHARTCVCVSRSRRDCWWHVWVCESNTEHADVDARALHRRRVRCVSPSTHRHLSCACAFVAVLERARARSCIAANGASHPRRACVHRAHAPHGTFMRERARARVSVAEQLSRATRLEMRVYVSCMWHTRSCVGCKSTWVGAQRSY
jgi:hypothetical protein